MNYPSFSAYAPQIQAQQQPMTQFTTQQIQAPISAPTDDRIWVQSEIAAEAYLVAPNATVHLWDSAKPYIYIRKSDAAGRPMPLEIYEYKRREETSPTDEYKDIISALEKRIEALEQKGVKSNAKSKSNSDDTGIPAI